MIGFKEGREEGREEGWCGSVAQSCDRLAPFVGPGFDSRSRCCSHGVSVLDVLLRIPLDLCSPPVDSAE